MKGCVMHGTFKPFILSTNSTVHLQDPDSVMDFYLVSVDFYQNYHQLCNEMLCCTDLFRRFQETRNYCVVEESDILFQVASCPLAHTRIKTLQELVLSQMIQE